MKLYTFDEFVAESIEDGKYLDYPERKTEPYSRPGLSKEIVKQAKEEYKEYLKTIQKINGDNLEILASNLKKAIVSAAGNKAFKLHAEDCKFASFYFKSNEPHDFFTVVEQAVKGARLALETEDVIDVNKIQQTRPSSDGQIHPISFKESKFLMNLYWCLGVIAQAYNVEFPKFDSRADLMTAKSYAEFQDEWYSGPRGARRKMTDATADKLRAKYEKGLDIAKKAREAFKKTKVYNDITDVLDLVERDVKSADNNYIMWNVELEMQAKRNEEAQKLKEAMDVVSDAVKDAIYKEYDSTVPRGAIGLQKLAAAAYMETGEMPNIIVKDSHTTSWLAGMHHKVVWEVVGKNGTSYGTIETEDNGLDGDDGRPAPGFGPYD
jgi:spore coat polysaccharide biosynthesis protein SpsF (cytidylyltransferase family)